MSDMGDRIRQARRAAGLTQADLAGATAVTQPTVNRWESGEFEPNRDTMEAIGRITGAAPAWLAFGDRSEDASTKGPGVGRD